MDQLQQQAATTLPGVAMRAFDLARSGTNRFETILTPAAIRRRGLRRLFSLNLPGDARGCEAQPLLLPAVQTGDGKVRNVVLLATMANRVFAFDADSGSELWQRTLGRPIKGSPAIDAHMVNDNWGILSTPVVDEHAGILYACAWISDDGTAARGRHALYALAVADGRDAKPPLDLEGAAYDAGHGAPTQRFRSAERKQRAALTLTQGAVLIPFGTIAETASSARGWLIAVDTAQWAIAASWCATARGSGGGIWQSGAGPAVDAHGDIFVVTGNGDFDAVTDFGESIVKLRYTPPASGAPGRLEAIDWWSPWTDDGRIGGSAEGESGEHREAAPRDPMPTNLRLVPHLARQGVAEMDMGGAWADQDFGAGGPVLAPASDALLAAGKDGILYTADPGALGRTEAADLAPERTAANYAKLKTAPIFYTYYPGAALDAAPREAASLNVLVGRVTHHLHGTPVVWEGSPHGTLHLCGGENGNLRAWSLSREGVSTYLASSAEAASPQSPVPPGGMPGWMISLSAHGGSDGVLWALVPYGDANMQLTPGRLLAYDVTGFGRFADGSGRIEVIWDSQDWGEGCAFTHPKFNRPVAWNGRLFVPTYDARVDVYGLA